jgi:putative ABC transport system substrate-binding protein
MIARRAFVVGAAAGFVAMHGRARAQGPGKLPRVGYVGGTAVSSEIFVKTLQELGHVQGRTMQLDVVLLPPENRRYSETVAKFVTQGADVIVASNPYALEAVVQATRTIPVVGLDLESDPVAKGWVASLARPGGNVTGIFLDIPEISGKQLQFLREAMPKIDRIEILGDPRVNDLQFKATEAAARALRLTAQRLPVTSFDGIPGAFAEADRWHAGGLVALTSPLVFARVRQVAEACVKHRLAAICPFVPAFAEAGGLLAYGPVFPDLFRRLAGYVDQVLKGGKPAELPVQRPEKFELVVNLKTARVLQLDLPQSLVLRANRVIE